MALEDQVTELIAATGTQTAAAEALTEVVVNKIAEIDTKVTAAKAEINQFIADSRIDLTKSVILPFNRSETFTKAGLAIVADNTDNTQSEWKLVTPADAAYQNNAYLQPGRLTYLHTIDDYSSPPGYYESPPYITDKSRSHMRFLVTNKAATPAQVKEQVAAQSPNLEVRGLWGIDVQTRVIPCIAIPNVHVYMGLWVQFFNVGYGLNGEGSDVPQEITAKGGNSYFTIESIEQFSNLDQ